MGFKKCFVIPGEKSLCKLSIDFFNSCVHFNIQNIDESYSIRQSNLSIFCERRICKIIIIWNVIVFVM